MKYSSFVGLTGLVSNFALGNTNEKHRSCETKCLTDDEVTSLIDGFRKVVSLAPGYEKVAPEVLAEDFTSISDSVNFVDQIPLNTTMTHSLSELLQQEAKLPPVGTVKDLFIANNCLTITWYFEFATKPLPTRGIAILFVDRETRKIWKSLRETNVGATLVALGKPECKGDFRTSVGHEGAERGRSSCEGGCKGVEGY